MDDGLLFQFKLLAAERWLRSLTVGVFDAFESYGAEIRSTKPAVWQALRRIEHAASFDDPVKLIRKIHRARCVLGAPDDWIAYGHCREGLAAIYDATLHLSELLRQEREEFLKDGKEVTQQS